MKHYGDITKINGAVVEPVNVIIGGSPCQDLSVAGKQKGIKHADNDDGETTRSGLFMEQLRIIKEMRCKDIEQGRTGISIRPRFMVWENVPGAFSSNKGADFQTVLEETIKVTCGQAPTVPIPKNGWPNAGCLADMGGKWSVAWRVFDAQFWGVPQRRKRIALVADFGGLAASEILFERESVFGDIEPSRPQGESITGETEGGVGAASRDDLSDAIRAFCIQGNSIDRADTAGCAGRGWTEGVSYTLNTVDRPAVAVFQPGETSRVGGHYWENGISPTLRAAGGDNYPAIILENETIPIDLRNATRKGTECGAGVGEQGDPAFTVTSEYGHAVAYGICSLSSNSMNSSNPHSGIYEADTAKTLDTSGGNPSCNQGGIFILEHHPNDNRIGIAKDEVVQTLTSRMGTGGNNVPLLMTDQTPPIITALNHATPKVSEGVSGTLMARDYKDPQIVCHPKGGEE